MQNTAKQLIYPGSVTFQETRWLIRQRCCSHTRTSTIC